VGDHRRGARGSDDPSDVLADRSRLQKSTGGVWPVATRGDEPREPTSGLATPGESIGAAKARRKPGPRRQSRDTGGGFPPKTVVRKRDSLGATCRWKALWIEQAAPFDEGAGEAVLGASRRVGSTRSRSARGATESVRGTSPTWHAVDNAAARWQPPLCVCPRLHPHRSATGREREWSEIPKLGTAPSSALYLGPGRRKTGWRRSRSRVSARRVAAVGEAQAPRSGIRRSTGARVVSRLQKSARSIFLTPSRGAERQTENARGSTSRRFLPRQGGITPRRAKGCEAEVRKPNRERNEASLDRKVEDRVDGRRPGSMRPSCSNRRGGSSGPGFGGKLSVQRKKGRERRTREVELTR